MPIINSDKNISSSLILLLFTAFIATNSYSQIDMGALGGLAQSLNDNVTDERTQSQDSDFSNEDNANKLNKKLEILNNADDFGYQGETDFVNAPEPKSFEKPLKYFGYDFFNTAPSTFSQLANIPVPPDYNITTGDSLFVVFYGNKSTRLILQVNREGQVFLPDIGPVTVAGLTYREAKETIITLVNEQLLGTSVSVTLGSLGSINVFITGEANQPGVYTIGSFSTLTNAIFASGGVQNSGSLRNIEHRRNGELITKFDLYELLLEGNNSKDSRLMSNDVIFIPPVKKMVGIDGEVNRPAVYEIKNNESLEDLIQLAGGTKAKANSESIDIERISNSKNGYELLSFSANTDRSAINLTNGDLVKIYPVTNKMQKAILVSGHSKKPGFYSWKEGMKVLDIIESENDLLPMTDMRYVLLKRGKNSEGDLEVFQIDLEELFNDGSPDVNFILQEQDELIFFPRFLSTDLIKAGLIGEDSLSQEQLNILTNEQHMNITDPAYASSTAMPQGYQGGMPINLPKSQIKAGLDLSIEKVTNNRFYEYKIYQYCTIPERLAKPLIESRGFNASGEKLSIQDILSQPMITENDEDADPMTQMQAMLMASDDAGNEKSITSLCRKQLLEPLIDLIKRQSMPEKQQRIFSVFGNVYFPGDYPLSRGMSIFDAIKAAGGLKDATYTTDIEMLRSDIGDKQVITTNTQAGILDPSIMSIELIPGDLINVKKIPVERETVSVAGEVFFPGDFPISKNESLRNLIQRAGGLKTEASIKAAIFERKSLKNSEIQRLRQAQSELRRKILIASQTKNVGQTAFSAGYIAELNSLLEKSVNEGEVIGRLVIDLESILDGSDEDLLLEDGDRIIIPKRRQSISVIGEVFAPNAHIFNDDIAINEYIKMSGGLTEFADEDNRYIIKADGSIVSPNQVGGGFFRNNSNLEPGDTIVIPIKVASFSGLQATTEITQIVYQMAIAAAAVKSF